MLLEGVEELGVILGIAKGGAVIVEGHILVHVDGAALDVDIEIPVEVAHHGVYHPELVASIKKLVLQHRKLRV